MLLYYGQNAQVVHATGNYRGKRKPVHVITHARARGGVSVSQGCLCLLVREYHYILFVRGGEKMAAIWQILR